MSKILDSGERRQFASGAVRDIAEGKGRMDLLPLDVIADYGDYLDKHQDEITSGGLPNIYHNLGRFLFEGDLNLIYDTIYVFIEQFYQGALETTILDLSIHYEQGAKKYCERNWEKGIDCHCYIDSALRHCTKLFRGDNDEPHDRAFLWNLFGLLWTLKHKPEYNDLPFNVDKTTND